MAKKNGDKTIPIIEKQSEEKQFPVGRPFYIGDKTYVLYKEFTKTKKGVHHFVMLDDKIVYSSNKTKGTVSRFINGLKKNN